MPEPSFLYWDANVFLSYINNDPQRFPVLDAILEAVETTKTQRIVTSVLSKVEVAWAANEKLNRALSVAEEKRIDEMWDNPDVIEFVDFGDEIALTARKLMRTGLTRGWKLRTNDAIHLASAQWVQAAELQTYDLKDFAKFGELIGIPISEPHTIQPKLF
ncbi:MAG: PIN domain-containing protein [Anaerolineales bacterium]